MSSPSEPKIVADPAEWTNPTIRSSRWRPRWFESTGYGHEDAKTRRTGWIPFVPSCLRGGLIWRYGFSGWPILRNGRIQPSVPGGGFFDDSRAQGMATKTRRHEDTKNWLDSLRAFVPSWRIDLAVRIQRMANPTESTNQTIRSSAGRFSPASRPRRQRGPVTPRASQTQMRSPDPMR